MAPRSPLHGRSYVPPRPAPAAKPALPSPTLPVPAPPPPMEPTPAAAPARDTERVAADVPVELARWTRRFAGQRQVATGKVTSVGSIVEEALEAHRARHETPPPVEPASAKGKR